MSVTLLLQDLRPGADIRITVDEHGNFVCVSEDGDRHSLSINTVPVGHELFPRVRARRCGGLPSVGGVVLELEPAPPSLMLYSRLEEEGASKFAEACAALVEQMRDS